MKQLTCEMCGSTDLLKQEGVFVCQTCGTKYSVEEAKKMMIEGIVDVSGSTVKLDKSGELNNLVVLAERAFKESNYESAEKYYDSILRIDPYNLRANFYRSYCSTMQSKIINLIENFNATVNTAVNTEKMLLELDNIDFDSCIDIIERISDLAKLCLINLFSIYNNNPERNETLYGGSIVTHNERGYYKLLIDCGEIINAAELFYSFCYSSKNANSRFLKSTENALTDLKATFNSIPEAPYKGIRYCQELRNALCDMCNEINNIISKNIKQVKVRIPEILTIEGKIASEKAAKEQQAKNEAYWSEHAEEKQQLESEQNALQAQIKQLKEQVAPYDKERASWKKKREADTPAKEEKKNVEQQLFRLKMEQNNLGLFKGKEKKALQAQIDSLNSRLPTINKSIETEEKEQIKLCNNKIREIEQQVAPIKENLEKANARINEINTELTKDR